jgi:hypothetical protein
MELIAFSRISEHDGYLFDVNLIDRGDAGKVSNDGGRSPNA